jgi:hypothetical protein
MALSPEEISIINKKNASRSTGPRTTQGKMNSRMGSTVHGLTATKVVLPNESEAEIQELMDDWTAHYRASSPGRRALVDRAVTATLHHERSKRYLAATLREQVRGAERAFDEDQENLVRHYTELLPVDPRAAVRGLQRTAAGCRHILREWLGLETSLVKGTWTTSRRELATRLLGHKPEELTDEVSFTLRFLTLTACEGLTPEAVAELLDPRQMPDTLFYLRDRPLPPPEHSSNQLLQIVQEQIVEYEALARQLRIEVEEPARAAAADNAMVLKPDALALWIRYERMHDSMFHRSHNVLERPEPPQPEADPPAPEDIEEAASASPPAEPPIAEATPVQPPGSEPTDGPVVTGEPVVERQSKRVATDEPVAPVFTAENDACTGSPADAEAEPTPVVDSLEETGVSVRSWIEAIFDASAEAIRDAAAKCGGAPEGDALDHTASDVLVWRTDYPPEHVVAVHAAYLRSVAEQKKRRPRDG